MTKDSAERSRDGETDMVAFEMGGQILALPTSSVREIIEPPHITPVPMADVFAPGLMNNRGIVLPVADLRPIFGMPDKPFDQDTRIMILVVGTDAGPVSVGVIAEKVHAVASMNLSAADQVPDIGTGWPERSITGIGRWNGSFVHHLDIDSVLGAHLRSSQNADQSLQDRAS